MKILIILILCVLIYTYFTNNRYKGTCVFLMILTLIFSGYSFYNYKIKDNNINLLLNYTDSITCIYSGKCDNIKYKEYDLLKKSAKEYKKLTKEQKEEYFEKCYYNYKLMKYLNADKKEFYQKETIAETLGNIEIKKILNYPDTYKLKYMSPINYDYKDQNYNSGYFWYEISFYAKQSYNEYITGVVKLEINPFLCIAKITDVQYYNLKSSKY